MDDQLVISAVAAHRSLYDPSHIKYKDVELRNAIWLKIAGDLKMEGWCCLQAQVLSLSISGVRKLSGKKSLKVVLQLAYSVLVSDACKLVCIKQC